MTRYAHYNKSEKGFYKRNLYITIPLFEEKINSENITFCGNPYMYLSLWEERSGKISAKFGIGDYDDYDYFYEIIHPTQEIIHEIVNYMIDHEYVTIHDFRDVKKIIDNIKFLNK